MSVLSKAGDAEHDRYWTNTFNTLKRKNIPKGEITKYAFLGYLMGGALKTGKNCIVIVNERCTTGYCVPVVFDITPVGKKRAYTELVKAEPGVLRYGREIKESYESFHLWQTPKDIVPDGDFIEMVKNDLPSPVFMPGESGKELLAYIKSDLPVELLDRIYTDFLKKAEEDYVEMHDGEEVIREVGKGLGFKKTINIPFDDVSNIFDF